MFGLTPWTDCITAYMNDLLCMVGGEKEGARPDGQLNCFCAFSRSQRERA